MLSVLHLRIATIRRKFTGLALSKFWSVALHAGAKSNFSASVNGLPIVFGLPQFLTHERIDSFYGVNIKSHI
jgi:hypothetical protein